MFYAKILAIDTDKLFSYLQSYFFVEHLPDKCFYNELVTAAIYIKKREKFFIYYSRLRVHLGFTELK